MRKWSIELDPPEDTQRCRSLAQRQKFLAAVGTRRTSDDQEGGFGMDGFDPPECLEEQIDSLEWLYAAHEEQNGPWP